MPSLGKRVGESSHHTEFSPKTLHPSVWHAIVAYLGSPLSAPRANENRPFLHIPINDFPVHTLFDTGSQVSLINKFAYLKMPCRPRITPVNLTVSAANGSHLKIIGQANFTIGIGSKRMTRPLLVVDGLQTDCIIGSDTMGEERISIDVASKRLRLEAAHTASLRVAKRITLEPKTEKVIYGVCNMLTYSDQNVYVSPLLHSPADVHVAPCIVKDSIDGKYPILLTNVSDRSITIPRGAAIAALEATPSKTSALLPEVFHVSALAADALHARRTPAHSPLFPAEQVDFSAIPLEHRSAYLALLTEFLDIFSVNPDDVGHCTVIKQKITLKDPNKVACTPAYRLPHHLKEIAIKYVDKLLAAGIIRKSTSPFCSPLMLVRKPGADIAGKPIMEQYRCVHDLRNLNKNVVFDAYPLRNLVELLDEVASNKIWTIIDLSQGFWSQELDEGSKQYTAFGIPGKGHYEYNRSVQGLCNSSAAFQRLLDHVLAGVPNSYVYIDDVIACNMTHKEHLLTLRQIFTRFRKFNLKCRLSKLQLGAAEVNYLGYNVTRDHGIRAGKAKIEAVAAWPPPKTVTEIKQFLGLASFFRRTIHNFASIASPLTRLTRKDATWRGGELPPPALTAFRALQRALCSRPCLTPVNYDKEFIVTVDAASNTGFGAILSQIGDDGVERPCAYASRSLSDKEVGAASYFAEHQSMLWACRHFKPYLTGRHFTLRTDHKPLLTLNRAQGQTLGRIYAELEEFLPYSVVFLKGSVMPADGLSRLSTHKTPMPDAAAAAAAATQVASHVESPSLTISPDQLYNLQRQDMYCKALACYLRFGVYPTSPSYKRFVLLLRSSACLKQGIIYIQIRDQSFALAPYALRETLMHLCHDNKLSGHFSSLKTFQRVRTSWYWPNMRAEIDHYCRSCHVCNTVNRAPNTFPTPLEPLPPIFKFNQRVSIDLLGPLTRSASGNKYLCVMTDYYSKLANIVAIKDKTAETVAQAFTHGWITQHGCPEQLLSDQGKEFANKVFTELCKELDIQHTFSSPGHPRSNGLCERMNRTLLAYYRKYLESHPDWEPLLPSLIFSYNTAVHSSTGYTPFFLAFNRLPSLPHAFTMPNDAPLYRDDVLAQNLRLLQDTRTKMASILHDAYKAQELQFNKRAREKIFHIGDQVYVTRPHSGQIQQKLQPNYTGPWLVTAICPHNNYYLTMPSKAKRPITVHADRMKLIPFTRQTWENKYRTGPPQEPLLPNPPALLPTPQPHHRTRTQAPPAPSALPALFDDEDFPPLPPPQAPIAAPPSDDGAQDDFHGYDTPDTPSGSAHSPHSSQESSSDSDSSPPSPPPPVHYRVIPQRPNCPPPPPPSLRRPAPSTSQHRRSLPTPSSPSQLPPQREPTYLSLTGTFGRLHARATGRLPPGAPLLDYRPLRIQPPRRVPLDIPPPPVQAPHSADDLPTLPIPPPLAHADPPPSFAHFNSPEQVAARRRARARGRGQGRATPPPPTARRHTRTSSPVPDLTWNF